jgi:hypothetical protein
MRAFWLGILGLAVSCVTPAVDAPDAVDGAAARVVDANHGGPAGGLIVLPPLADGATGDFVSWARPEVVVERVGGGEIARFSRSSRTNPVELRYTPRSADDGDDDPAGFFAARLDTVSLGLVAGDRARIRFLLDGRELGRADLRVLSPARAAASPRATGVVAAGDAIMARFRVDRGAVDSDGDAVADLVDRCAQTWDPDQADSVGDGVGDACRCEAVWCEPKEGCDPGVCVPESGECTQGLCIEDAPATLTGHVVGRTYGWLDDAGITVRADDGRQVGATSGVDGAFEIEVPFGESELVVSRPGFFDYTTHLSFGPAQSGSLEITLDPELAWLDVEVWRGVGVAWPGAVVELSGAGTRTAITDEAGKVRFDLVLPGVETTITVDGTPANLPQPYVLQPGTNNVLIGMY